jgi:autotransporter-associated beta strand protein
MSRSKSRTRVAIAAGAVVIGSVGSVAIAAPGDQFILPIDHRLGPNVGWTDEGPLGYNGSEAWSHAYSGGGDQCYVYWRFNNAGASDDTRLYLVEWWDATPTGSDGWQPIESQFNGDAGETYSIENNIPWIGLNGTNHQYIGAESQAIGGATWRQTGPGPHTPNTDSYGASGAASSSFYMWLRKGSELYAKWDLGFPVADGNPRTWADLRLTEATPVAQTVYWDVNGTTAGAGGATPTGNWDAKRSSPNFNTNAAGAGANNTLKCVTSLVDTVVFAANGEGTGTYNVNVSGTQWAAKVQINQGNVTYSGGAINAGAYDVAAGASATVNSTVRGSIVKQGAGTVTLTDNNPSFTGGTTVQAGKLQVKRLQSGNAVTITAGTLQVLDSSPTLPNFPSGANAFVSRPGSMITIANNGGLPGNRVYFGTLDLGNNDLIIDYSGASPFVDLNDMVRSGFNFGDWLGKGITSSTAANPLSNGNYALGVAENGQLTNPFGSQDPNDPNSLNPQFDNQTVDNTTVLVKFTHRVDLDLDGLVSGNDAAIFNGSFSEGDTGATWQTGDVDYDGTWSSNDAAIFNSFYDESLAHLPEPASMSLLAFGLLATGSRRRRA